ncbi:uncharacterized protein GLRG_11021 [Colletotrichum graminicola M1.001]|uniref:Uncharacterized protein n=1 Tax=Colletotrichum graminicola (strain M1.001 / M2 / FGSC 10212) TaxID=645133 RepID=E3QYH5_COLGM|nr:uncharacterized protein GLRG_11021 [Colletotrichum graminicola M1.001]EFQ35913.1 hypothetical protein GLRG_11021 [Colletotrichum graminicola M1.001]
MSASPPPESQPIPSSRTWLSSPSPSSPTPSSPSPSSPSFTVLRIRLCFPPAASAATTPRYGDTQVVNMAFGHDFVPTPDVPLSLYVRRRGPVRSVYGDVDCLPQVTAYNLYTINQDVHIGRATNPTNPALDSASESSPSPAEFEADAEPETAQEAAGSRLLRANPPQATPLLLGAIALTLAAAVVVVLYLVVTPLLGRPLPCGGKMDETRTPPPVCKHKRAAPLTLFDDLAALLARRANAPLPLTVTAQAVIDQHYNASHGLSDPTRASTPITVFFVHLRETSAGLCDDTTDWALESKSPMLDDLVLLCSSIHDSLVDLPTRWLDTSGFMSFPYSYKSITAISTFVNALEQHAGTDAYADPSENNMLFYNTTSSPASQGVIVMFLDVRLPFKGRPRGPG